MRAKKYSNMNSKKIQKNRKATETRKQEDRRIVSWQRRLGGCPCERLGVPSRAVSWNSLAGDECRSPEKKTCVAQRHDRKKKLKKF